RSEADKMALIGFFSALRASAPPVDSNPEIIAAQNRTLFSGRSGSFRSKTSDILGADAAAFQLAWTAYQTRRRRILILECLPLFFFLAGLAAFWRMRRSQAARIAAPQALASLSPQPQAAVTAALPAPPLPGLPAPAAALLSQSPLTLPAVVAQDYRLEESLGKDSFGFLYEGIEIPRGRKVFIRHLRPEISQAGADMETLLAEARLSALLKHPGIVDIYALVRDGEEVFMAFEPVRGKSLADLLGSGQRVTLNSVKRLIRPVAEALDWAHGHKVIHRDLKPSCIWIAPGGAVKVADFGISSAARVAVAKRVRDENWGSDPYMAPEQDYGMPSRESDIFSLGVIFYEMLAGHIPFMGPNFSAQKREMVFPPVSQAVPGLHPAADAVVLKALMADPKKRCACAAEFADAVDGLPG
ncbi:MAG: serine/threonine-protein kinase, partial [candidate division NC10 bacterium]